MRLGLFLGFVAGLAWSQESLKQQIAEIASEAQGTVAVACSLPGSRLNCDVHPDAHSPMQSVFKLPLAIAILHQVEQGKFTLDQDIRYLPSDRFRAFSPLQDKYPAGDVDVPLRELLRLDTSLSDNVAADILLRLGGGPEVVSGYIASLGVSGFHLLDSEKTLHEDERLQYRNWFAPSGAVQLLRLINDHSPLTRAHTELLVSWMRASQQTKRLQGDLPKDVVVAHKSGTSGMESGLAAATNDIGLIQLPDGRQLAIAVFITDAKAQDDTRDRVIARIAQVVYEAALQAK